MARFAYGITFTLSQMQIDIKSIDKTNQLLTDLRSRKEKRIGRKAKKT